MKCILGALLLITSACSFKKKETVYIERGGYVIDVCTKLQHHYSGSTAWDCNNSYKYTSGNYFYSDIDGVRVYHLLLP